MIISDYQTQLAVEAFAKIQTSTENQSLDSYAVTCYHLGLLRGQLMANEKQRKLAQVKEQLDLAQLKQQQRNLDKIWNKL